MDKTVPLVLMDKMVLMEPMAKTVPLVQMD